MKKTIICVKGSTQTGKTPTIRDLYALIATKEEQLANTDFMVPGRDIHCITTYKGIQVGFYSYGDPGCHQHRHISDLINSGCDLVICACRNRGQTKNDIDRVAIEFESELIYTSTYLPRMAASDFVRKHFVSALMNLIDSCIATHTTI